MPARVIQFPQRLSSQQARIAPPCVETTQQQANRIVEQVVREIANLAFARAQNMHDLLLPRKVELETPVSVARRILFALRSFAQPA